MNSNRAIPHSIIAILSVAVMAAAVSACASEPGDPCPKGARYSMTSTGVHACLFDHVRLPDARGVRVYCDSVYSGHVDFEWEHNPWTMGYSCPVGWERTEGLRGQSSCRSPGTRTTEAAPRERLACGLMPDGAIAMAWKAPAAFSSLSRVAIQIVRGVSPFVPDVP
jgi:hypothetical protein